MLTAACNSLAEELAIPYGAPGGMPVYRLSLTLSFFYKFYLLVSSQMDSSRLPDCCKTAFEVNCIFSTFVTHRFCCMLNLCFILAIPSNTISKYTRFSTCFKESATI